MRDSILAKFKAKYPDVNLSKKRLDAIVDKLAAKITDENEIEAKLDELNDFLPFADIAKQDDKIRDLEAKAKKTPPPATTPDKKDDPPAEDPNTVLLKTLLQKVEKLETEKVQTSIQQKVSSHEKIKGIPAQFLKGKALPEKEEDIDAFVEEVANDYTAFKQELTNQGFAQTSKPVGSAGPGKEPVDPKQIDAILDSI